MVIMARTVLLAGVIAYVIKKPGNFFGGEGIK